MQTVPSPAATATVAADNPDPSSAAPNPEPEKTPAAESPASAAPQTTSAAEPQAPDADAPADTSRKVHRKSGISIKMTDVPELRTDHPDTQPAAGPLTQESLEACWKSMLEALAEKEPKLVDTLRDRKITLDGDDHFVIEVGNSFVEAEIRPHLLQMLELMRSTSGHKLLNCYVKVVYEERQAVIYAPRDKYDVMSKNNPALDTFRILFPEVDL